MTSKEYFERALKVIPGGVHSPVRAFRGVGGNPLFFERAEGAYLKSVEGDLYIDFCQSFGPNILGHRDPDVSEEVKKILDKAWSFGACEPYSLELSEWITERVPWVEKLRLVCSGTEAVMSAIRVARGATGRYKILKFEGCYNGHADSLLVQAGSGLAGESAKSSSGVPPHVTTETLVASLNDEEMVREIFSRHGEEIACVIIEPLPANYGLLIQRESFINEICDIARSNGALVIFDEVISGFRIGLQGMAGRLKIRPDLVTYGKVIGGGFPVGCYGGKGELMDLVAPEGSVYQAGTLAANPVSVIAGLSTLKKMERQKGWEKLAESGSRFASELREEFGKKDIPLGVSQLDSLFWFHSFTKGPIRSVSGIPKTQSAEFHKFFNAALKRGVYLAPSAFEVGFLSMAHNQDVMEEAIKSLVEAAAEAYEKKT